ncbi:MAG: (deoxy)nucleoside triphosphate pyrophosphohydrolase [Polyangiaceae bacterium]
MLVVAAVIENDRGEVLICQRPRHKHHGGLWELPGGKVEPNETLAAALVRELREELALDDVAVLDELFRFHDPSRQLELVFLRARTHDDPVAIEHEAIQWIAPSRASQIDFAPADTAFFEHYLAAH